MTIVPTGEHEVKNTFTDDGFVIDHAARTDSPTFRRTKALLAKARCWISGHIGSNEQHHALCEFSLAPGIDWAKVKNIAIGHIKELPILDPATDQPTGEMAPVQEFAIFWILEWTKFRGFEWSIFDPAKPESFVDSPQNMVTLSKVFHTGKRGIHRHTLPFFLFFAWPRLPGVVYTPDEESQAPTPSPPVDGEDVGGGANASGVVEGGAAG